MGGEFVEVGEDEALHQPHQVADLFLGPLPVFGAESVERHRVDAEVARRAHDRPHRLDAGLVTGDAGQQPLFRPAAIAVHDDGDMARAVMAFRH